MPLPLPQKLYFCEYSLHFFKRRSQLLRHLQKCPLRHPPGDEIYRNGGVSMFEVSGRSGVVRVVPFPCAVHHRPWC